ncbi:TPA: hypothetical protein N0F65_005763, partial [Lagenidium giganteum]
SANCIKTGKFTKLSEQEVTTCAIEDGCDGSFPHVGLSFVKKQRGLSSAASYPYTNGAYNITEQCKADATNHVKLDFKVVKVSDAFRSWGDIAKKPSYLRDALKKQPVAIGVTAGNPDFKQYNGGVLRECGSTALDHAVFAVGYSVTSSGSTVFKVRNSWGGKWGEQGYFRVQSSACRITDYGYYPALNANCIKTGKFTKLSEQELTTCSIDNGCKGSFPHIGLRYVRLQPGLSSAAAYPYTNGAFKLTERCEADASNHIKLDFKVVKVSNAVLNRADLGKDPSHMRDALKKQPVAIGVTAGNPDFKQYNGGVLRNVASAASSSSSKVSAIAHVHKHPEHHQRFLQDLDQLKAELEEWKNSESHEAAKQLGVYAGQDGDFESDDPSEDLARLYLAKQSVAEAQERNPDAQGKCGSCWAFATVAALESANCIKTGNFTKLSEQEVTSCTYEDGCEGGYPHDGLSFVYRQRGLSSAASYPYTNVAYNVTEQCSADKSNRVKLRFQIAMVKKGSGPRYMLTLRDALKWQPVAIGVGAGNPDFKQYTGGVLRKCGPTELDHFVIAVGYSVTSTGTTVVKARNSWGSTWGEQGYFRVESTACRINEYGIYPDVALRLRHAGKSR